MKLAKHHNLWLALCVLVLAVMCYMSISAPIKFKKEQQFREQAVISRLSKIRVAELSYCRDHKVYTGDFNVLIKGGYLADSLQYIPFSDGKRFDLAATVQVSKSGRQLPLAECGATYDTYLNGLDENSIANIPPSQRVTLRLSSTTMSFAVIDDKAVNGLRYEPYVVKSGMSIAANLRKAFTESELLSQDYQRAQVLIDTPVMLIPLEEFVAEDAETLYHYTFTGHKNDEILNTILPTQNAVAVYPINKDIKLVLTDHIKDIRIMPLMQPVWNYLHKRSFIGTRNKLFAYFRGKQMEVFSFSKNRFRFCNRYDVTNYNDAAYYMLYVWKQLNFDAHEDELHLCGVLPDRELLSANLKEYVQKVSVINPMAEFNRAPITKIKHLPFDMMTLFIKGR